MSCVCGSRCFAPNICSLPPCCALAADDLGQRARITVPEVALDMAPRASRAGIFVGWGHRPNSARRPEFWRREASGAVFCASCIAPGIPLFGGLASRHPHPRSDQSASVRTQQPRQPARLGLLLGAAGTTASERSATVVFSGLTRYLRRLTSGLPSRTQCTRQKRTCARARCEWLSHSLSLREQQ